VTWGENGELVVKTHGPQTASWEMASGGTIVLATDENGHPIMDHENSQPEYWFRSYPSAADAASVAPVYAEQSTAQMEYIVPPLTQVLTRLIEALENMALKPEGDGDGG
jgi:hypothetical protein